MILKKHIKLIFFQETKSRGLIFQRVSSLLGELAGGVIKSNSRIKTAVHAHEEDEKRKLKEANAKIAQLEREMEAKEIAAKNKENEAKEKVAELQREIVVKDEEIRQISEERDKSRAERDQLYEELRLESEKVTKKVSENKKLKVKVTQVEKELGSKIKTIEQMQHTTKGLTKALDLHAMVNEERVVLDEQVDKTERIAKNAKRMRTEFEDGPAQELKKVSEAVGYLVQGDLGNGLKLIHDSEELLGPTMSRNQKRKQRWMGVGGKGGRGENRRGKREGGDSLLLGDGDESLEAELS